MADTTGCRTYGTYKVEGSIMTLRAADERLLTPIFGYESNHGPAYALE